MIARHLFILIFLVLMLISVISGNPMSIYIQGLASAVGYHVGECIAHARGPHETIQRLIIMVAVAVCWPVIYPIMFLVDELDRRRVPRHGEPR